MVSGTVYGQVQSISEYPQGNAVRNYLWNIKEIGLGNSLGIDIGNDLSKQSRERSRKQS
jgi:hypothetical protein